MATTPGTLYVFFHGLSVSQERGNTIEVVLPRVAGHSILAGSWLAETALRDEGLFRLIGVDPPSSGRPGASFAPTDFTIRLQPGTSLTSRHRAATLVLQRPQEILGLRCATDPDFVAQTGNTPRAKFTKLASVVVLVYSFPDKNEVQLEGHYWQPTLTGNAMSLHFISTSLDSEGLEHEEETEHIMHGLVRNYPGISFNPNRPLPPPWNDQSDKNYGDLGPRRAVGESIVMQNGNAFAFAQAELEPPAGRAARIARLGRLHQARQSIQSLWRWPDALTDSASNCPPLTI